jgi:hypothetical protein
MHVEFGRTGTTLPANSGRPGPYFAAATIPHRVPGPVPVTITQDLSFLSTGNDRTFVGSVAATRLASSRRIPLHEACGRYVDWYQLS